MSYCDTDQGNINVTINTRNEGNCRCCCSRHCHCGVRTRFGRGGYGCFNSHHDHDPDHGQVNNVTIVRNTNEVHYHPNVLPIGYLNNQGPEADVIGNPCSCDDLSTCVENPDPDVEEPSDNAGINSSDCGCANGGI